MAGFKMHITTSTICGIGYGVGAFAYLDMPGPTCVLAGGLCSVSGMLPDLDSDSGIPLRESIAFAAAVVPMLMIDRFRSLGFTNEAIALAGALVYLGIRFGMARFLKKFTVHRGMFHSLPAAAIFAELAFLVCGGADTTIRLYKAGGVLLGFMSHLILDEFYSIEWHRGRIRLKKSFGTALKLWGNNTWGNISTYAKLAVITFVVMHENTWQEYLKPSGNRSPVVQAENDLINHAESLDKEGSTARMWLDRVFRR